MKCILTFHQNLVFILKHTFNTIVQYLLKNTIKNWTLNFHQKIRKISYENANATGETINIFELLKLNQYVNTSSSICNSISDDATIWNDGSTCNDNMVVIRMKEQAMKINSFYPHFK